MIFVCRYVEPFRSYKLPTDGGNSRHIISRQNYREATDSKRYVLRVEAVVAEKLYAESRANQQKILRYWTKYANLCASFLVGLHS